MAELLVELGCEELPPKELPTLAEAFRDRFRERLAAAAIACDDLTAFHTPRRLALSGRVAPRQSERLIERRGPSVKAGLDEQGQPTPALIGFARSLGVEVAALERVVTDKGEIFAYRRREPGRPTAELLPDLVAAALAELPIVRPMRWGEGEHRFVRPVQWLVMLLDEEVVPGAVLGASSSRFSRGHRFHHPQPVAIACAGAYREALREAKVLVDPSERGERILAEVRQLAQALGRRADLDESLLAELVALTEWPRAILCSFDEAFLRVPGEVLTSTMVRNQRFIPLRREDGALACEFIGIANLDSADPARVRHGYERVIRPRFADAAFFWDQDRATPLAAHRQGLAQVVYQQSLGTLADKSERVARLAESLAPLFGLIPQRVREAALLCRCDLLTRLVGEFPELQGTIGRRLAEAQGLEDELAAALEEFYRPRFAGDRLPERPLAQVLALADRLDTLAGGFAAGLKPTGNRDPFALRRAAAGIARILTEQDIRLDLKAWLAQAAALQPTAAKPDAETLYDFVLERLRADLLERGVAPELFEAVAALRPPCLVDFLARIEALAAFRRDPRAEALILASKRIRNILRKSGEQQVGEPDAALLAEEAERMLASSVRQITAQAEAARARGDYRAALATLAALAEPLERFFAEVLVLCEDEALRRNRLALLATAEIPFRAIAEFALLPG